jgi:hypothetical protein
VHYHRPLSPLEPAAIPLSLSLSFACMLLGADLLLPIDPGEG